MRAVAVVLVSKHQARRLNDSGALNAQSRAYAYGQRVRHYRYEAVCVLDDPVTGKEARWLAKVTPA